MRAPAAAGDDGLATEDERLLLAQLREHFADDLQRRTAEGRAHSCCFGDLALTRVLRGNDGDLAKATAWLARFLQRWDACDLDTMLRHLVQEWDRVGSPIPLDSMLPYYGEVQHFVRAVFTAPKPSPQGDLINYISLARFEMAEMIDKLEWEHWVQYMYGATVMRMIECDRQSRAQGRLVKAITLIDVGGVSVSMLNCPQWHKQNHRDIGTFQEHIAAEVFGEVCILNTPWLVMRLYDVVSVFIPERFRRKVRLLRGDGTDDPAFVALAGGIDQLRQLLAVRHSLFESPPHAGVAERSLFSTRRVATVSAGQEFALSVDVAPGQHMLGTLCRHTDPSRF
ncbi:unnamed protein product [Prorocentrum cordatum]|uniref:CRAL-TRIO domain-containing protein n=1 Tax=Prorocentrum cordatum TaxID=2364126 RepID=A0ABN9Q6L7_9DINO|nr:unnamed protein product [Polarella glacialis]